MISPRLSAVFLFIVTLTVGECAQEYTPLVVWHGLGDSAYGQQSRILDAIAKRLPGIYIKPLRFGKNEAEDRFFSFFANANDQVEQACRELSSDPKLAKGFNAMGVSQGGQLLRGMVQRCSQVRVKNLITLGSQHHGVYGLPMCPGEQNYVCDSIRTYLTNFLYTSYVQANSIPAQYWKDPRNPGLYVERSVFLADINNEGPKKNQTYVRNLNALQNLVMVRFSKDRVVQPIESSWFGFYKPGQALEIELMNQTALYKENWLGLQEMNKNNKLKFLNVDGGHIALTEPWFVENVLKYLK